MPLFSRVSGNSSAVMGTVTEGENEDHSPNEDNDESHVPSNCSGGSSAPETTDKAANNFSLAASETAMILYSKGLLLVAIAVVAVTTSVLTYFVVKSQENTEYENEFHNIAKTIEEFSQLKVKKVLNTLEHLGASLTSEAMNRDQKWPFVLFPDFQVQGMLSNEYTGAHTITLNPFVLPKDLDVWASFSVYSQGWVARAHAYDRSVHQELYQMGKYESTYAHNESLRWNETGITPFVWKNDKEDRYARVRVSESMLYAPIWQRAPACDFALQVNMDLRSDSTFTTMIDSMLAGDHAVITTVVDATYLETNYEYRFDPQEQAEPHSYLLVPVYDTFIQNRTAVAFLSSFFRWGSFFTDVLPSTEKRIFVVLESSCNQIFTYEILGHNVVYLGDGDHHDSRLDSDGLQDTFEFAPTLAEGNDAMYEVCHYYAHIYASHEWRAQYFSSSPYVYAAAVFCCFSVTAIGFIMYDVLVQRRQKKVMRAAAKTNAIVTSLFPENVRDRLLENQEHEMRKQSQSKAGTFLNLGVKRETPTFDDDYTSAAIFGSRPIADLFPDTTIMFGDLVGFTAWSSMREPTAVFTLLETLYHAFDTIAKRRRVFKVETIGDCYVAVCGLPTPRKDHAVVMGKFASECQVKTKQLVRKLEVSLGPDTGDLNIRIGLHSGPVTAGVLRGDKGRFQLFGDTMNTASRVESTGCAGRIHISRETAEALIAAGREKWVTPREDQVFAKGKGSLTTYWFRMVNESDVSGSNMSAASSVGSSDKSVPLAMNKALNARPSIRAMTGHSESALKKLTSKEQRLVAWNVDMLVKVLMQIMARRAATSTTSMLARQETLEIIPLNGTVLDEVKEVLALPHFDAKTMKDDVDLMTVTVPDNVVSQLMDMVSRIAGLYRDNPFHSFEHASHVTMSVTKLLSRIISSNSVSSINATHCNMAELLHDHTFGITSDPLTQFACLIAALIHDADHLGLPNTTLVKEGHPLSSKYKGRSVAEQNSVDLAWDIIMSKQYKELQACFFSTTEEFKRFRSIVVNVVMATDIMDKDLGAQRKARWEKAFSQENDGEEFDKSVSVNRKATIVLEHLMQASDVSHTMQHWVVFKKWNERLFVEMYKAYVEGHSDKDPSEGWYRGELGFFDYYIIPLAKKLETCGVFGVSSHEYLSYAQANRREWEEKGEQVVKEYLRRYLMEQGLESQKVTVSEGVGAFGNSCFFDV